MRKVTRWTMVAVVGLMLGGGAGCAFEDGARDGVVDGVSAALSDIIQAPVGQIIAALFPDS